METVGKNPRKSYKGSCPWIIVMGTIGKSKENVTSPALSHGSQISWHTHFNKFLNDQCKSAAVLSPTRN